MLGGVGSATRIVGLLGGILTYAVEAGVIETNPAHGIRKPKDRVRNRDLTKLKKLVADGLGGAQAATAAFDCLSPARGASWITTRNEWC